jgi:hypothetical protein
MEVQPTPISEITGVKGDADLYDGGTGTVIGPSPAAQYLMHAANAQAELNKYVAEAHEKHVNDTIDEVGKLDFADVLPEDLPSINDNDYVIANPSTDINKYSEIRQQLGALKSQILTSRAHNAVYKENQKTLLLHPELNTDENQQAMQNFTKTPVGKRTGFLLKTPATYDPTTVAAEAMVSTGKVDSTQRLSANKKYIIGTDGTTFNADEYVEKFKKINDVKTDAYGRTGTQNMKAIYDKMPAEIKPPSFEDYEHQVALATLPKDKKAVTITANQVAMNDARLAEDHWATKMQTALGYARLTQEGKALKLNEIKPEEGAEAKYLALHSAMTGKGLNYEFGQNIYGSDPATDLTIQGGGQPLKDDQGNFTGMSPITKQKIPVKQFETATPDGKGGLVVTSKINSLDKHGNVVSKPVTESVAYGQAQSDFNRIYGNKFTPAISSGSSIFNKKKLNTTNPAFSDLDKYFRPKGAPATPAAAPAGVTDKDPLGLFK